MDYIRKAAAYLQIRTCLQFPERPVPLNEDHIYVTGDSVGCAALVGRRGGGQRIRLQPNNIESGCFRFFTIVHEFLHALGFHHMQNVYDRDTYIRINWENVRPESVGSFDTRPSSQVSHFAVVRFSIYVACSSLKVFLISQSLMMWAQCCTTVRRHSLPMDSPQWLLFGIPTGGQWANDSRQHQKIF